MTRWRKRRMIDDDWIYIPVYIFNFLSSLFSLFFVWNFSLFIKKYRILNVRITYAKDFREWHITIVCYHSFNITTDKQNENITYSFLAWKAFEKAKTDFF